MDVPEPRDAPRDLERMRIPFGGESRTLAIGDWAIRIRGLDATFAETLDRRWGPFCSPDPPGVADALVLSIADAGDATWIEPSAEGETYRIEARTYGGVPVVTSYAFAARPEDDGSRWQAAVRRDGPEPAGRVLENLVRVLVARRAVELGGIAMHAAGVLRDGDTHLFVGPSGAGKSTAVGLSAPCVSLGDDFGFVVPDPEGEGWRTAAVPFDNAERVSEEPPSGWLPVAGVWRLVQAEAHRVERPARVELSVLACAAMPWAMPDLGDRLLENAARFAASGPFGHLHFRADAGFWDLLRQGLE